MMNMKMFIITIISVLPSSAQASLRRIIVTGGENGIVAYYSLNGTRLNGPRPGVCIVRYAHGKVRKIVIR